MEKDNIEYAENGSRVSRINADFSTSVSICKQVPHSNKSRKKEGPKWVSKEISIRERDSFKENIHDFN